MGRGGEAGRGRNTNRGGGYKRGGREVYQTERGSGEGGSRRGVLAAGAPLHPLPPPQARLQAVKLLELRAQPPPHGRGGRARPVVAVAAAAGAGAGAAGGRPAHGGAAGGGVGRRAALELQDG
jgi:hypothetical protein